MKKVAIDFHNVISIDYKFWSWLIKRMRAKEIEVHIITGGIYTEVVRKLVKNKIDYDYFYSISYSGKLLPDLEWDSSKGTYCKKHNIDLIIDDTIRYKLYMPNSTHFEHWIV